MNKYNNGTQTIVEAEYGHELVNIADIGDREAVTHACDICYGDIEDGDDVETGEHILAENSQKKGYNGIFHYECGKNDAAEQFMAATNRYYDWTSEARRIMDMHTDRVEHDGSEDGGDEFLAAKNKAKKEILAEYTRLGFSHSVYTAEELYNEHWS